MFRLRKDDNPDSVHSGERITPSSVLKWLRDDCKQRIRVVRESGQVLVDRRLPIINDVCRCDFRPRPIRLIDEAIRTVNRDPTPLNQYARMLERADAVVNAGEEFPFLHEEESPDRFRSGRGHGNLWKFALLPTNLSRNAGKPGLQERVVRSLFRPALPTLHAVRFLRLPCRNVPTSRRF